MQLIDSILTQAASLSTLRRDIHAHPELCFQEVRTAELVATRLTDWGITVHRGMGTTGVVGHWSAGRHGRAAHDRAQHV
jgi:metal-dependent amidase/aminoacylase/carboxypeptidase family protein